MKSRQQVHLTVYCINVCIVMFLCSLLAHCRRVQNSVFAAAIRAIKSWWDAHQWAIRFASMWWRGQFHEHMLNWIQPKFQRRSVPVNWYSCFRTCLYTSAVAKLLIDPYTSCRRPTLNCLYAIQPYVFVVTYLPPSHILTSERAQAWSPIY